MTNLEWTGELQKSQVDDDVQVELDEDETDPLKILAQSRAKQKIVKVEKPEESLITAEDLKDIERIKSLNLSTDSTQSTQLDPHATYLMEKEDHPDIHRTKFKPYQTTTSNVHDPQKEIKKVFKYSEITAATPPLLRHPGTKMLSLHDSLELQMVKDKEMKVRITLQIIFRNIKLHFPSPFQETQQREAELRLAEKATKIKAIDFVAKDMSEFFRSYRVINESSDEEDEEETTEYDSAEEVLDIDAQEEVGGVNFTVRE